MRTTSTLAILFITMLVASAIRAEVPEGSVWIDVRTPSEYARGHLPQATLIPFDGIEAGVAGIHLAKDAPIYLYCAVGGRAEMARKSLLAAGYTNVTNVGSLEAARELASPSTNGQ